MIECDVSTRIDGEYGLVNSYIDVLKGTKGKGKAEVVKPSSNGG